ncbi:hypothetical protein A9239_16780 [Methanosarcina sp. A14]|nr:hypothetical protein A9239_16780 [Methanosarcina sp. A14]
MLAGTFESGVASTLMQALLIYLFLMRYQPNLVKALGMQGYIAIKKCTQLQIFIVFVFRIYNTFKN